jgi:hypothetical protein
MIETIKSFVGEHGAGILAILGAIYVLATAIAAVTPTTKDDAILAKIREWLLRFGMDLSKHQPADKPADTPSAKDE